MKLKLVPNDAKILREKCVKVKAVDDEVRKALDGMVDFCKSNILPRVLALAANQGGINQRLIVIFDHKEILRLANPKIIEQKGTQRFFEACVNVGKPNDFVGGFVDRPAQIKLEALDYYGEKVKIKASGILAVMLCHEIDHLDGILYTDKLVGDLHHFKTPEERLAFRKNLK